MSAEFVNVHITDIAFHADKSYVYSLTEEQQKQVGVGSMVSVPFGRSNRTATGIVTSVSSECDYPVVKPIHAIVRDSVALSEEFVRICLFMRSRYYCSFGTAMKAVLPPGYDLRGLIYYTLPEEYVTSKDEDAEHLLRWVELKGRAFEREIIDEFGNEIRPIIEFLVRDGCLCRFSESARKPNEKIVTLVELTVSEEEATQLLESAERLSEKQKELITLLLHYPRITVSEVEDIGGISASVVTTLCKKGIAQKVRERVERKPYADIPPAPEKKIKLNSEQKAAVTTLCELAESGEPKAALLLGITGSGKTAVITEVVKSVVAKGKTAIIMLPEIGLTAQALHTYRSAFGDKLAVIHSALSAGERIDAYRAVREGRIKIVVGTRSAVFAPFENLGIIVMDEEQESSYKSELTPKYHARDIARLRAVNHKCLMLLASATPSMESYYKAQSGAYTLVKLTKRIGDIPLPEVVIEDMRADKTVIPDKHIGSRLDEEISERCSKGEQAILFVNRRGYNSQIICRSCGTVVTCPNCSVALTYHAYMGENIRYRRLSCHYCGYSTAVPNKCAACESEHIGFFGFGTQALQEELETRYPKLHAVRMDADTTGVRYSHDKILDSFSAGDYSILFGTQMVCKGLDFANVSLSAVISVDSLLYMNDFRAGERTFSLLTQLIGRAGRSGGRGLAVLQTMNPEHEIIRLAATQDYEAFAKGELAFRKSVLFPPFCSIAVLMISCEVEETLIWYAEKLPAELRVRQFDPELMRLEIYGPYPEGIYKIGGRYRQKVIIKFSDNTEARKYISDVYRVASSKLPPAVRLDIDINPVLI